MKRLIVAAALALSLVKGVGAVEPSEMLKDPALEARAQAIGHLLRCPVCKTESIEESDAELTKELRRIVRERIAAGDSDQQVLDYLHSRYGNFILLKPPFEPSTWALWLAPPIILVLGGALAFAVMRRRQDAEPAPLSDAEQRAVEALR